jgi:hypothetical protein
MDLARRIEWRQGHLGRFSLFRNPARCAKARKVDGDRGVAAVAQCERDEGKVR